MQRHLYFHSEDIHMYQHKPYIVTGYPSIRAVPRAWWTVQLHIKLWNMSNMFCTFMCTHECLVHVLTYVLSIIKHSTLCGGPLRQYRACVGTCVCLPSGSTDVAASPSQYMIQPSGIPILSPVLFMHVGDPYIPSF